MNNLDLNKLSVIQKQNLIMKLNYKRYAKLRWNIVVNFIIGLIFCLQFSFKTFNFTTVNTILTLVLITIYFLVSIPVQVYYYYTKLPTKTYQIKLKNITVYIFQIVTTIINLLWFIFNLVNINKIALSIYVIIIVMLILQNLYIVNWVKKVLITNKDKYNTIIKNMYLSLNKKNRDF